MSTQELRIVYGAPDGTHWIIEKPDDGLIPPPVLEVGIPNVGTRKLTYMGFWSDVVTMLCNAVEQLPESARLRGRNGRLPVQHALAVMLGVSQQSISRYMNAESELDSHLDARLLIRAYFAPQAVLQVIATLPTVRPDFDLVTNL